MQWNWVFSLVKSTLLIIFAMAITNNYNSVDGLRCFSCIHTESESKPDPAVYAPACTGDKNALLAANLSVECESNMKFCLLVTDPEAEMVVTRACTTGIMATMRDTYDRKFVCQTDNCNWYSHEEAFSAIENKSSGLVRSDYRVVSNVSDQQKPAKCLKCESKEECSPKNAPWKEEECYGNNVFCYAHFRDNDAVWRSCGERGYIFFKNKYMCRTDNCNKWTTSAEVVAASKVPGGGVIDGRTAKMSYEGTHEADYGDEDWGQRN